MKIGLHEIPVREVAEGYVDSTAGGYGIIRDEGRALNGDYDFGLHPFFERRISPNP